MAGTIIIGCGGNGRYVASRLAGKGYAAFSIDWTKADLSILPPGVLESEVRAKYDFVHEQLIAHRNEILLNMCGASQVILFASLGGAFGSASVNVISGCARELGIRIVSMMTIPFEFEWNRRPAVMYALPTLVDAFDKSFLVDPQYSTVNNKMFEDVMSRSTDTLADVLEIIFKIMDEGPFMSTFPAKAYTFSYSNAPSLASSCEMAESKPFFDRAYIKDWKLIVCPNGNPDHETVNLISRSVADRCGIVPDVIPGSDDGTGATVFFPLSFRSVLLPFAALAYEFGGISEYSHDSEVFVFRGDGASHHPAEHYRCGFSASLGVVYSLQEVTEELEQALFLVPVSGIAFRRDVVSLEHLVEDDADGMGEVHHGIFVSRRDGDEEVAPVQFRLQKADVLSSEHYRDLLAVSPGLFSELPDGNGYAGEVLISLRDCARCAGYEETSFNGIVEGRADDGVLQNLAPVFGAVESRLANFAGVDKVQFLDIEICTAACYRTNISLEFGADHDDTDFRHLIGLTICRDYLNKMHNLFVPGPVAANVPVSNAVRACARSGAIRSVSIYRAGASGFM